MTEAIERQGGQLERLKKMDPEQLAKGLGWFSVGLGLTELLAPRVIARICGVRGNNALIRTFGARELFSGLGIFAQGRKPAEAVWSRVAGDAMDLAALGVAFTKPLANKKRVAFATANVLAVTALDVICAQQLTTNGENEVSSTTSEAAGYTAPVY